MCGIFGFVSSAGLVNSQNRKNFVKDSLYCGTLRGSDGAGIFTISTAPGAEELTILKDSVPGFYFLGLKPLQNIFSNIEKYRIVVGHNRAATFGEASAENTHPFKHGKIVLVHNGTINNLPSLSGQVWAKHNVDSAAICQLLDEGSPKELFPRIKGAFAFVWYNTETKALYIYRNKERELYLGKVKGKQELYFASEYGMLAWMAYRNGIELSKIALVPEFKLLEINEKNEIKETIINPEKEKVHVIGPGYTAYRRRAGIYKTSEEILLALGINVNDSIEFSLDKIEPSHPRARHGILTGLLVDSPYTSIMCFGVELDKFSGKKLLSGKVITAKQDDATNENCIIVSTVVELSKEDPFYVATQNDLTLIPGPKGPTTLRDFRKLVQDGCAYCSSNIFPVEASKLTWTPENRPVCNICSRQLGNLARCDT